MELVGFYTPDYLARKLALVREKRLPRLVLCVDHSLGVADDDLPKAPVANVIATIERSPSR